MYRTFCRKLNSFEVQKPSGRCNLEMVVLQLVELLTRLRAVFVSMGSIRRARVSCSAVVRNFSSFR